MKVRYLHSDIDTLERIEIIRDLRRGEFDVLVGINLLREGLDIPEVSLVGDPRRRQGGLPALDALADPDHRPRRAQRQRPVIMYADRDHRLDAGARSTRPSAAATTQAEYNAAARHHAALGRAAPSWTSSPAPSPDFLDAAHAGRARRPGPPGPGQGRAVRRRSRSSAPRCARPPPTSSSSTPPSCATRPASSKSSTVELG